VGVFAEVRRVLRGDGVCFINIGDSYAGSGKGRLADGTFRQEGSKQSTSKGSILGLMGKTLVLNELKPKDLIGIPWMLAFALRADGWWLRSDIVWAKLSPMPESVNDRPTRSHEYLFLLSKSERYFYDAAAIAEKSSGVSGGGFSVLTHEARRGSINGGTEVGRPVDTGTRNKRDVFTVNSEQFPGAHYAVMPAKLVEPCVLAGTSPQACEHCGAPWAAVTEKIATDAPASYNGSSFTRGKSLEARSGLAAVGSGSRYETIRTTLRQPTCRCINDGTGTCTVLDPFFGSGTTAKVALSHGRSFVGVDLDERNVEIARQRIGPMLLETPEATTPIRRVVDKQAGTGNRTAAGFNARWTAKEAAL
jgi:DNA modification methylase